MDSTSDQTLNLEGDTSGKPCLHLFGNSLLPAYFEYAAWLEDCASSRQVLLVMLTFNTILVVASLLANCLTTFRGRKLQKRASKYRVQITPQAVVLPNLRMPENLQVFTQSIN